MNDLFYLLFATAGTIVIGSFVVYSVESQHPDSQINLMLDVVWWNVSTVTTVEYVDVVLNPAFGYTASKFYADYGTQFAGGETVRVLVKVIGEPTEGNPADLAKEIRFYQAAVLKFILFAGAINVVSDQNENQFTATMTKKLADHVSQRPDVISVTVILHDGQTSPHGIMSPKKQMAQGVDSKDVICKPGLELVFKKTDRMPTCVKPESVQRLISINWAMDKFEQDNVFSNLPTKSESVTTSKVDSTQNLILNITPDYIDGQRQLIFEGSGWKGFHVVTIHITNNQGYFYELKTKTAQSGELFMPWFVPQDLNGGIYHFYAFVGDQSFEIDIPITQ